MRHLVAKDIRLVAPWAWVIVLGHVLWCAQAFLIPELYFWFSLAAALGWTVAILLIEWHLDTGRFVASLPVTRATVVKARYASALGGVAVGAVLYVLYGHAIMAVATERVAARSHLSPAWASADGVLAFVIVGYALVVAFLPFYFRLGLPLGGGLFAVAVSLGGVVAVVPPSLGVGGLAGNAGAVPSPPSEAVRSWLSSLAASLGPVPAALAIVASLALAGGLSLWLSTRFYEGREL